MNTDILGRASPKGKKNPHMHERARFILNCLETEKKPPMNGDEHRCFRTGVPEGGKCE
jgi:hypothetical protein